MRRPVSERDAIRSQVIDVLKAQIKRRPAMKKVSTAAMTHKRAFIAVRKMYVGADDPILPEELYHWDPVTPLRPRNREE